MKEMLPVMPVNVVRLLVVSGLALLCSGAGAAEAPTLADSATEVAERTASYLTATTTAFLSALGDGNTSAVFTVELSATDVFAEGDILSVGTSSLTEAGSAVFGWTELVPGTQYYVRTIATGSAGPAATNETTFTTPAGFTQMCYKPPAGLSDYPWDSAKDWFSSPGNYDPLNFLPSLGDDVVLYSSKNVNVPLRVGNGVHAETRRMTIGNSTYHQQFLVEDGGTVTNAENLILGGGTSTSDTAAHIRIASGGEWRTKKHVYIGYSAGVSSLTVDEGGCFINSDAGEFIVSVRGQGSSLTNNGEITVTDFFVGGESSSVGYAENSGILNVARKFTLGRSGFGRFHLKPGGTINMAAGSREIIVGSVGTGELVLDDDWSTGTYVTLGNQTTATGRVTVTDATLDINTYCLVASGREAYGEMTLNGAGCVAGNADWHVGRGSASSGRVTLNDTAMIDSPKSLTIGYGAGATGIVEVLDSASITNIASQRIDIAAGTGSYGQLTVDENVFLGPITNLSIAANSQTAIGLLNMQGGTIAFVGGGSGYWSLFLGRSDSMSASRVHGWGSIKRAVASNTLRLTPHGQFVADGGGEEHDLDFSAFRTVGYNVENNASGTNGWYAVGKGRLIYPRMQNCSGSSHTTVGDYPTRAGFSLVNSFRYTMTTYPAGTFYNFAELYAADRSDIPVGLSNNRHDLVKGVWRVGFSSVSGSAAEPTPVTFEGMTVKFRYDPEGIEPDHKLGVYHHDGSPSGGWSRVSGTLVTLDPANPYIETTTAVDASSETWNAGWFAIVARKPNGTVYFLR